MSGGPRHHGAMEDFFTWATRGIISVTMMGLGWLLVWQRRVERDITLVKERVDNHTRDIGCITDLPTADQLHDIAQRVTRIEASMKTEEISSELKIIHQRIDTLAEQTHKQIGQSEQMNKTLGLIHDRMMRE